VPSQAASIGYAALDGVARTNAMLFRALGNSPRDAIGLFVALLAAGAILTNALYMQPGPHPAPIFSVKPRPVAEPAAVVTAVPRARPDSAPVKTARSRTDITADIQRELSRRGLYDGPTDGVLGPKTDAAIRDFESSAKLKVTGEPTEDVLRAIAARPLKAEPAPRAAVRDPIADLIAPQPRVTAVQRALNDYGYGPVKATGVYGAETVAAIEKVERDRKLPVTGQISPRLMRELAALTGRPLE